MTSAASPHITRHEAEARHPGELLRNFVLPHLGVSVSQAARDLGVARQTLHRIFDGSAIITPEMALRLEAFCGVSAMYWLRLQSAHEIHDARASLQQALTRIPNHKLSRVAMKQLGATDGR
ncbi:MULTISPECIES: HigA family addiction module antitoxin [unclassified Caballeronia]|uniref:HigA family addiction module antitoxin n=1 Tax=unclassified Caballeronia TaxID=2646786 RepID=UPI0028578347|nr:MULTISPECIES: HigA family addiction module antitoxin [unclassified Caballeronia]MDR5741025.1 HigA family addiction module antitoxin [Caballeronia sp. LZ016]MDR5806923.1 HigA family addiction module antitoxin [Caballeronia sp. LZ019]